MENATIVDVINMTRFEPPIEGEVRRQLKIYVQCLIGGTPQPYFQIRWMKDGEIWDDLEWKVLADIFKFDHGPTFYSAFKRYNDLVGELSERTFCFTNELRRNFSQFQDNYNKKVIIDHNIAKRKNLLNDYVNKKGLKIHVKSVVQGLLLLFRKKLFLITSS